MTGIEPVTSSLPRKHSTPELHRRHTYHENRFPEERRKTTIQFSIFKINFLVGREGFEPSKVSQRIYSPSSLAA